MTFIPVPNSASLCFFFVTAGQNWQTCITVEKVGGAPSEGDLQDLADLGYDWWVANMDTNQGTAAGLAEVRATDLTSESAPSRSNVTGGYGAGGAGILPLGTALVASLRTPLRGRSYRGRMYWGGLAASGQSTSTECTTAYAGYIASAIVQLLADFVTAGWKGVVATKQHNGAVVNPADTSDISTVIVDTKYDSQRRRLAGRGA